MGRAPCCDKASVKKGPWSPEEDRKLKEYIDKYGTGGNWIALPHKAGLKRCGKSCRLRWLNYLRPNIKHGDFSDDEDRIICNLFASIGSRWSIIAAQLPGRTDNDIKNYWNTKLKKKLMGLPPTQRSKPTHQHHKQQQQQQLFFPPVPPPPPHLSDTTATAPPLFSLQHISPPLSYSTTTSLLASTAGGSSGLLMFGGDHHSSCSSSDNGNLYFELCHNSSSTSNANANANGNAIAPGFESFLFGGFEDTQKLLLAHNTSTLDQYTAAAYEHEMKPLVLSSNAGAGADAGASTNSLFYTEEPTSTAGASQGRFLY